MYVLVGLRSQADIHALNEPTPPILIGGGRGEGNIPLCIFFAFLQFPSVFFLFCDFVSVLFLFCFVFGCFFAFSWLVVGISL